MINVESKFYRGGIELSLNLQLSELKGRRGEGNMKNVQSGK